MVQPKHDTRLAAKIKTHHNTIDHSPFTACRARHRQVKQCCCELFVAHPDMSAQLQLTLRPRLSPEPSNKSRIFPIMYVIVNLLLGARRVALRR
jgi:hypothetical protein